VIDEYQNWIDLVGIDGECCPITTVKEGIKIE
jgi:hypothetical protein